MNIHYNTTTGQIMSYGFGSVHDDGFGISHFDGCKVLIVDDQPIDARTQRVDPASLAIVAKATPDPEPDRIDEVRELVRAELAASDRFVLPDPRFDADRAAWFVYRQALRDSSKGNDTAAAMLAALPETRPDGSRLNFKLQDLG